VSKLLPQAFLYDLFAIGDAQGSEILRKLERTVPTEGSWGDANPSYRSLVDKEASGTTIAFKIKTKPSHAYSWSV
jgi:hypothetical protein